MAEYISKSKGFGDAANSIPFNTYVPELEDAADIRNALELFYFGNSEDGTTLGDVSLYATLVDFDTRISANDAAFDGHTGAISDVHGTGAGNLVVGTGTVQTLTNKTLTSPVITGGTVNGGAALTVDSTELNYVDGVTSSIQTQINTNTPTGMISIHSASVAPAGWLICDGTSYSTTTYANLFSTIGYTFGGSGASFSVPNLKGKVVVGIDAAQAEFNVRGETGGSMTHQHDASNSGSTSATHNHTVPALAGTAANAGAHNHNTTTHSHSANHGHGLNVPATSGDTNLNHTHTWSDTSAGANAQTTNAGYSYSWTSPSPTVYRYHTHTVGGTTASTNLNHTHSVGGAVDAQNALNTGNTAPVTNSNNTNETPGAGGTHSHSVTTVAEATIDGGTTTAHTHTTPASSIESSLQPYMALNYIIKI